MRYEVIGATPVAGLAGEPQVAPDRWGGSHLVGCCVQGQARAIQRTRETTMARSSSRLSAAIAALVAISLTTGEDGGLGMKRRLAALCRGNGGTMKRVVHVVALTGLMTLVAGWVAAAPAGAATPQVSHTQVNVSLTGIDVCGFTVDSVVQGTDTFEVFVDQFGNVSIQDLSHVVSTLTNEANGKVVYVEGVGRDAFQPDPVVNRDGTITATDTLTGMDVRVYTSNSSTLVKDVGFLSMVATFDAQGNFLSEQVIEHGPHQFAGDSTVFCDAITSAIG
jgi:hypothetical protein